MKGLHGPETFDTRRENGSIVPAFLAVIEEIVKLIPGKPIRFVVNSHQHFDHAAGLRTYMHIGSTIITRWKNFDFYNKDVLNFAPRTLKPDMVSLWPPTELAEGYYYELLRENYVLSDGTRKSCPSMAIRFRGPISREPSSHEMDQAFGSRLSALGVRLEASAGSGLSAPEA